MAANVDPPVLHDWLMDSLLTPNILLSIIDSDVNIVLKMGNKDEYLKSYKWSHSPNEDTRDDPPHPSHGQRRYDIV